MTPEITIEKSKGQHIETPITSERSKILTFRKKRWNHNDEIFQIRSTCFLTPDPPCRLNVKTRNQKIFSSVNYRPKLVQRIGFGNTSMPNWQNFSKLSIFVSKSNSEISGRYSRDWLFYRKSFKIAQNAGLWSTERAVM